MSFIALDLGASGTRYTSELGAVRLLPNNMVFLDKDTKVDLEPQSDRIESALEVVITKTEDSSFFPVKALIGEMAARYSSSNVRPSMNQPKNEQQVNYISGITAAALARLEFGLSETMDMYIALPPVETKSSKAAVQKEFAGEYTVSFPKYGSTGVTCKVIIQSTECHEESFLAVLAYFFGPDMKMREEARAYSTGSMLSIDIGASSTDFAIVKESKYLDVSGYTIRIGGNVARDLVINAVKGAYGFELPTSDADIVMMEGRLPLGNSYADVGEMVAEAKRKFASQIIEKMQSYFSQVGVPIQTLRAIMVSGGGSLESQYVDSSGNTVVTSKAMSHYVTDDIQRICPTVDVVHFGEGPRFANINGLFIRATANELRKRRNEADAVAKAAKVAKESADTAPKVQVMKASPEETPEASTEAANNQGEPAVYGTIGMLIPSDGGQPT